MDPLRELFSFCLGFFLGVIFTLAVVCMFQFLAARYPAISSLYSASQTMAQAFFETKTP